MRARSRAVGISLDVVSCARGTGFQEREDIPHENPANRTPSKLEKDGPGVDEDDSNVSEGGDLETVSPVDKKA